MTRLRAKRFGGQAPRAELDAMINRQPPEMKKLTKAVLAKLRPRFPGAIEMVYDKANTLVIGFCPDERASNVITSMAVYRKWINLYFFEGDAMPDPEGLLKGSGAMVRHVRITSAEELDRPAVKALISEALKLADPALDKKGKRQVVIRQRKKRAAI